MLTKWFASSTSRSLEKDRSFRPRLEYLEQRNAPSAFGPGDDHGHGHGHDHGPPHGPPPPPVNNGVVSSTGISSGVNAHGSFNGSTITDSFNNTINYTVNLMPAQKAAVAGLFSTGFSLGAMNPQLGSLVNDEIALAVDTYLTSPAISAVLPASVVSSLDADKATLSAAIAANPLDSTLFGQVIGSVAYGVTLHALTSAQATI